jgi:hypothetical protein
VFVERRSAGSWGTWAVFAYLCVLAWQVCASTVCVGSSVPRGRCIGRGSSSRQLAGKQGRKLTLPAPLPLTLACLQAVLVAFSWAAGEGLYSLNVFASGSEGATPNTSAA